VHLTQVEKMRAQIEQISKSDALSSFEGRTSLQDILESENAANDLKAALNQHWEE